MRGYPRGVKAAVLAGRTGRRAARPHVKVHPELLMQIIQQLMGNQGSPPMGHPADDNNGSVIGGPPSPQLTGRGPTPAVSYSPVSQGPPPNTEGAGATWGGRTFHDPYKLFQWEKQHGNQQTYEGFYNLHPALQRLLGTLVAGKGSARGKAPHHAAGY